MIYRVVFKDGRQETLTAQLLPSVRLLRNRYVDTNITRLVNVSGCFSLRSVLAVVDFLALPARAAPSAWYGPRSTGEPGKGTAWSKAPPSQGHRLVKVLKDESSNTISEAVRADFDEATHSAWHFELPPKGPVGRTNATRVVHSSSMCICQC
jgi:hypothetical protein